MRFFRVRRGLAFIGVRRRVRSEGRLGCGEGRTSGV